jgi:transcriptional regulator with XRE-family HTH domain
VGLGQDENDREKDHGEAVARRSPTVRERRLARALRHLREEAHLTIEDVAEKLEISASTVSRMETAQVGVRPRDLRFLLDMYQVSEAERDQLLQIARERRRQRWWREYADLANIHFAGLEADASIIWQYSTQLIPGLLQTEAYARAVLQAIRLDAKPGDIERRLELRIHRQELLASEPPPPPSTGSCSTRRSCADRSVGRPSWPNSSGS